MVYIPAITQKTSIATLRGQNPQIAILLSLVLVLRVPRVACRFGSHRLVGLLASLSLSHTRVVSVPSHPGVCSPVLYPSPPQFPTGVSPSQFSVDSTTLSFLCRSCSLCFPAHNTRSIDLMHCLPQRRQMSMCYCNKII